MGPAPVITIVTRTQGRPRFLARCLQSVISQTRGDWRLVLVNDGGLREDVERVVASRALELAGRVEIRHRAVSEGMEAASNFGFAGASTPWLTLLDDDDTWDRRFLERMLDAAAALPFSAAGVACHSEVVIERDDADSIVEVRRYPFNTDLVAVNFERVSVENCITNNAFVFRRETYEAVGGFDESFRVYGDWDFVLRVLLSFDIEVLPERLACYHRREGGVTPNSFQSMPHAAERYRARMVNVWLRGERGRSPAVGALIAQGAALREQRALMQRLDKYLNALHRLRNAPGLKRLERLFLGR
ncbi:MAG: glycosyltransferase [Myxococcota bacterium]